MAIIKGSNKLLSDQNEERVQSEGFIFFRMVTEGDVVKFMTATASEDSGTLFHYDDQKALLVATRQAFIGREVAWEEKADWKGRPYVEALFPADADVLHIANSILDSLGFVADTGVQAIREVRAIQDEFGVDDDEDAYLSDGMYATTDGRIVRK